MRTLAFVFLLVPLCGQADINPYGHPLEEEEKARVFKLAQQTCHSSVVEVEGFSSTPPDETLWEAEAWAYLAPLKSKTDICKSFVCGYLGSKPNPKGRKAPGGYTWRSLDPSADVYRVWLAEGGECRGSPASKILLGTMVEENTLRSLLDQRSVLAEQGREWVRKNESGARWLDDQVGALERIEVEDHFGTLRYWLEYGGQKGLSVYLSSQGGRFVVEEAGPAGRP